MHLFLLGLILLVGILVYYIMTPSGGNSGASSHEKNSEPKKNIPDDLRKEDNVIFLPNSRNSDDAGSENDE